MIATETRQLLATLNAKPKKRLRLVVECSAEQLRYLKIEAAKRDKPYSHIVQEALYEYFTKRQPTPPQEPQCD